MTNADYIRKMSDEELASILVHNPWMLEKSALAWLKEYIDAKHFKKEYVCNH